MFIVQLITDKANAADLSIGVPVFAILISVTRTKNTIMLPFHKFRQQESCAIAKMTAQCALYMGAMKIFGTS